MSIKRFLIESAHVCNICLKRYVKMLVLNRLSAYFNLAFIETVFLDN